MALSRLEQRIRERAGDFTLAALLELLAYAGYGPDSIYFKSYHSQVSQVSLVRGVEFSSERPRRATVQMNLGLLSAQGPLPSYFQKNLDSGHVDTRAFRDFIAFFEHHLIGDYIRNLYPEMNRALFPDFEETRLQYLLLKDLRSLSTLHWLFDLVFPELDVSVEKAVLGRGLKNQPVTLGKTRLGDDSVFGKVTNVPVRGVRGTLYCDEELFRKGKPWPIECRERLSDLVFPLLRRVGVDLEVFLVIRTQKTFARLHRESYLGYDRIRGGEANYRRIRIFTGRVENDTSIIQAEKGVV